MGRASMEYALFSNVGVVAVSYFERSLSTLKSVGAALQTDDVRVSCKFFCSNKGGYDTYIVPVVYGKEKFYHALSVSKLLGESVVISSEEGRETDFFNYLMGKYDYPLLKSWKAEIFQYAQNRGWISNAMSGVVYGENFVGERLDICVLDIVMTEENLKSMVSELLKAGKICISDKRMEKMSFSNMDEYFANYGHSLVQNLEKQIQPLSPLDGNIKNLALNNMKLYPQQGAQVNGVMELLKRSRYAILNMGMGTGKTICSTSIVEGYFVQKYLNSHPGSTLKDAYADDVQVNYRNIVMCPGHLVEKWKDEIAREVPYAKVSVIREFRQLVDIEKGGAKRAGKEWYIISKDFAKLSYQSVPVPSRCGKKRIKVRVCNDCQTPSDNASGVRFSCKCGSNGYHVVGTSGYGYGMLCPQCNELLMPNMSLRMLGDEGDTLPLSASDFASMNGKNQRCHLCGTGLWQPYVRNINTPGTDFYEHATRVGKWHRATHYANKTHKGKKTVWVHSDFADEYFSAIGEKPLREKSAEDKGVRRYAPASFIKKHLKGYFDIFILDEAHLFKGGATAQGNAMHALVKSSRHQLMLTGTIAGGMATHLFYLLYRLDPRRMQDMGYGWADEMKFAHAYGTIEKVFEASQCNDDPYNQSSKGKQVGSPSVKPGISPLIFRDFLLDKTVFLDLTDMSRFLPPLREYVVSVNVPDFIEDGQGNELPNPEKKCHLEYERVIKRLKEVSRIEGRGVLSMMLQFSLSYLDKPYGVDPIKSPKTGNILAEPADYHFLVENNGLLAKEKELVKIVGKELGEGRNCVIYCEYTSSPQTCVTYRLKEILAGHCRLSENEVTVIESNSPATSQREAWMHKKAEDGTKVFIVNPRCVETGLDFCWNKGGKLYNYPTLVFYQLGYSLFTIWQASRRAYRLNQREECRTYYMAYSKTVQQVVISLIAEKQVATSAIQGKFSVEGLSAMAQGVDVKVRLAQAMSNMDSISGNGLQEMFDVLNQDAADVDAYGNYVPMLTYRELMGEGTDSMIVGDAAQVMMNSLSGMFNFTVFLQQRQAQKEGPEIDANEMRMQRPAQIARKMTRKERRLREAGQMTMF
jgi:hypothetical protein